jgi:exosome complex component RRP4
MPITILSPQPPPARAQPSEDTDSDSDSNGGADIHGDVPMRTSKRRRAITEEDASARDEILTPGTVITTNPQWMR